MIKENAPRPRPWCEAEVIASGIVRSGREDRVEVLLFVDRPTTNKAAVTEPVSTRTR